MKRQLRISYISFSLFALLLGACAKDGLNLASKSVYQSRAEASLRNITSRVNGLKGVRGAVRTTASGIQDISQYYANPAIAWQPYNDIFQKSNSGDELEECRNLLAQLPRTKAYYRPRVILAVQCGLSASSYRDPMMTAMYRNSTNQGQSMWQYDSFWRFPQGYNSFQNQAQSGYSGGQVGGNFNQQGFQFLNQYLGQGYIPQTITYR